MIEKDNFRKLLVQIGFTKKSEVYEKKISDAATILKVDFKKQELIYPEDKGLIVNERQTCNFSTNENFVVFECVHRLLSKGYKPEHIELEPKWKVGRGASGGRADILVKDNFGKPLLIIECKTAGAEFSKAWNKTLQDGDQLFSYAQQISETQFLCLYTSDFTDEALTYQSHIIAHRDNDQYLAANPYYETFRTVNDVKERFAVWRCTYKHDFTTKGLFEDNIQPYQIGKDKYSLADLHAISASDQQKKYHEFATILRQHNVSGRENAFDKLVNLFLCKLVDEIENPDDLKFYWKGVAYDSHFDLMDRLQQLYQAGMGKFLGEAITYINQTDVNNALRFIRQNPDATQRAVWNLFMQQKFFTNNDFSFIDVHNERLFYQNAEVLLKILQMWQDIRLTNPNGHNQFLGDMFEGFLDQGIKQSEGQFFTPMPICRFIIMSLPLERLIRDNPTPPLAIDYACGAGHFLTELAFQMQPLLTQHKPLANPDDYHKAMIGIEKEYRLSKVAKVSAFMYGQKGIQICYGDGLVSGHEAFPDIQDGRFDLLVANPPYSVRGFLETLPAEDRKTYSLADTINDAETANSIETFFIERAKQLLKAGGVAAVILPSSILSNGGSTYIRTREILLQYFDIIAIAEFASGTFGKTGTNTVTLFLRRKPTSPDTAEHYRERVEEWFNGGATNGGKQHLYKDAHLIEQYCAHINVPQDLYQTLLNGELEGAWKLQEHFQPYHDKFDKGSELANLCKQKRFKALSKTEQKAEIARRCLAYVQAVERDKLYHFVMASDQPNPVLIIRSPAGTKEIKQFLGYDWSSAKGDEGIKLIEDSTGRHITALYEGPDRANPMRFTRHNSQKLNHHIAANFEGKLGAIPAELSEVANTARLVDMLDFSRIVFEKQLTLVVKKYVNIKSKWPLVKLGSVCSFEYGKPLPEERRIVGPYPVMGSNGRVGFHNEYLIPGPAIIVGRKGSAGEVVWETEPCYPIDTTFYVKIDRIDVHQYFLLHVLKGLHLGHLQGGTGVPGLNRNKAYQLIFPLPPIEVQNQIANELKEVDKETTAASDTISKTQSSINGEVATIYASRAPLKRLDKICDLKRGRFTHRPRNDPKFFDGKYPFIQTGDVVKAVFSKVPYTQTLNEFGLTVSKLFQPPVVLVTIAANIGDTAVLDYAACFTDSVVGLIPGKDIDARFLELMMRSQKKHLNEIAPQLAQKNINLEILKPLKVPVPSLAEQKEFVSKVEALEKQIAAAQAVIDAAPARKEAVMKKYL